MARTTTRFQQAPKRDRRCVILDANVRKHWRKLHCRDRNVGNRGYNEHPDENGYDRRHIVGLPALLLKENLAEAGIVASPQYYLDEPVRNATDDESDDLWTEPVFEDTVVDELDIRACGCVGAYCSYEEYAPFDEYDDYPGYSGMDDYFDSLYGTPEDSGVA